MIIKDEGSSFRIMESELTQALASALGAPTPQSEKDYNLPIRVSLERAYTIADSLSVLMDIESCYADCKSSLCEPKKKCRGWRLPDRKEWLLARGDIDQKWTYMSWVDMPERSPQAIAQKAPNKSGLYDILGNVSEWVSEGNAMGGSYKSSLQEALSEAGESKIEAGIRLIRSVPAERSNE